jgi:hypothetical protein
MEWISMLEPPNNLRAVAGPRPFPTPSSSEPRAFKGVETLYCTDPKGGDEHFGFCRMVGKNKYYVWGECEGWCEPNPYPGIHFLIVEDSNLLSTYKTAILIRDNKLSERNVGVVIDAFFSYFSFEDALEANDRIVGPLQLNDSIRDLFNLILHDESSYRFRWMPETVSLREELGGSDAKS